MTAMAVIVFVMKSILQTLPRVIGAPEPISAGPCAPKKATVGGASDEHPQGCPA